MEDAGLVDGLGDDRDYDRLVSRMNAGRVAARAHTVSGVSSRAEARE